MNIADSTKSGGTIQLLVLRTAAKPFEPAGFASADLADNEVHRAADGEELLPAQVPLWLS